jgi:hypothetical protein
MALFALVYGALFTTFGTNPGGLWEAIYGGPRYWLDQQPVNRGGERWAFHLLLLSSLEWPVLVFGIIGLVAVLRRPAPMTALLAWTFVASLLVYSWASERFAWLTLHPLLALVPLAGIGVVCVARARSALVRGGGVALAVAGVAYLGVSSWVANGPQRVDPRSLLVAPQTTEAALEVRDELLALDRRLRRTAGRPLSVDVDSNDSFSFPWAWYLRDLRAGFLDMRVPGYRPETDAVIVSAVTRGVAAPSLGAYRARRFALRAFWGRDYDRLTAGGWWRWIIRREPWSPLGASSGWLYVRRDLSAPRARTTERRSWRRSVMSVTAEASSACRAAPPGRWRRTRGVRGGGIGPPPLPSRSAVASDIGSATRGSLLPRPVAGARAIDLNGGGVFRSTERNLRSIVDPPPQDAVRDASGRL